VRHIGLLCRARLTGLLHDGDGQRSRHDTHAVLVVLAIAGNAAVIAEAGPRELSIVTEQAQHPSALLGIRVEAARRLEVAGVVGLRRRVSRTAQGRQLLRGDRRFALFICRGCRGRLIILLRGR